MKRFTAAVLLTAILLLPGCGQDSRKESHVKPPTAAEKSSDHQPPDRQSPNHLSAGQQTPVLEFKQEKYNVLLITLDTFRRDRISTYSDRYVKTPVIDRLASRSVVFNRAFAHNPVTLPSHTNILTGTTPRYHGISDNTGFRLEERFLTIAEHLKQNGYSTGAFVASFPLDSRFGLAQGFDVYDDNYGTHNDMELFFVERKAEKVITPALQWLTGRQDKWFAWVHLFDAHQAYLPPPPFNQQYKHDLYSGEAAYVDHALQRLFDFLEQKGLMKNTVILLTADHGEALGEKGEDTHSYFAYNNTIHIPMILYVPGAGNKTVDQNVCHIDIFPTICKLLNLDVPAHLQGESMLPIINGAPRQRKQIYFESLTPFLNRSWAPLRGFVQGDMKYIDQPVPELYNIHTDPNEKNNLATSQPLTQYKRDLVKLKLDLTGKHIMTRSRKLDSDVSKRLKSLGYLSSGTSTTPTVFTAEHDLKTLLPLQNKMLAAVGEFQNGNYQKALTDLQAIIHQSPAFVLVYRHMATIYKETGQIRKAVEILETGLKKNPGNTNLMSKLGIILAEAGRPDDAVELLNVCVEREDFNPENYNFLGVAYYNKGDFKSALDNYNKALAIDRNYASVFNNIGSLYLLTYLRSKDQSDYQTALDNFSRALEIDPRLFAAYNGRGAAYKFKKQNRKAIADWQKTIEINPRFIDAYFNLAVAHLELGEKADALKYLDQINQQFSKLLPPQAQQRLARLLMEARR